MVNRDDECWETLCLHNSYCDALVDLEPDECPICLADAEGCPYKIVKAF